MEFEIFLDLSALAAFVNFFIYSLSGYPSCTTGVLNYGGALKSDFAAPMGKVPPADAHSAYAILR